jgi:uncharacterized protein
MRPLNRGHDDHICMAGKLEAGTQEVQPVRRGPHAMDRAAHESRQSSRPGTALITGASSGIGAAFARALAARGYDLILVARREERLATVADQVRQRRGSGVTIVVADLSTPAGVLRVQEEIAACTSLSLLINNAGTGTIGSFVESKLDSQLAMIRLHVTASVRLSHAALPDMIARGHGAIINVASIGAFLPSAGNVTYNATKAFLTSFSAALNDEVRDAGIRVQALCPGFTVTEFHDLLAINRTAIPRWLWMSADDVAAASLRALERWPVVYVPGWRNRALLALFRNSLTAPLLRRMIRRTVHRAAVLNEQGAAVRTATAPRVKGV